MSMRPEISGIMAAHSAAWIIGQAIDSMLAQTVEAWELIIVDDDSMGTVAPDVLECVAP